MSVEQKSCSLPDGTTLGGNYHILRPIGKGGMGCVYLAFDTKLDLEVAVKVISPDFQDTLEPPQYEQVLKRFEAEAKIAAKIDHPNVIRIYSFNRDRIFLMGRPCTVDYLVMELVSGRTLRNTMDVSGFDPDEDIRAWLQKYFFPALDGVDQVHRCGIIHRDVKPENFLLKQDVPKLSDFGLSKGYSLPPVTGSVADIYGTLAYMAPEQFYNFSLARETADIYSLGKILYEAVEGKISAKAKPFQQAKLSSPETGYRRAVNHIVMTATAVGASRRYQTVADFRQALLDAQRSGKPQQVPRSTQRRVTTSLGWGAALLLVTGSGLFWWPSSDHVLPPPSHTAENTTAPKQIGHVEWAGLPDDLARTVRSEDKSVLRLVPGGQFRFSDPGVFEGVGTSVEPFYLSETPITNQQYVTFLNANLGRARIVESDVYLDDRLALKLSEKIRDYRPITFEKSRFSVTDPMHGACAVLSVSAAGAEAYARYYGLRLAYAQEWVAAKLGSGTKVSGRRQPIPVISFEQDMNGLRGVDTVAEWARLGRGGYAVVGEPASPMLGNGFVNSTDETKTFCDTGFRVAMDAR